MTDPVQLIINESPQPGVWNMAVDESLLEESLRSGSTFVRLYTWSEATISLGYFQKPEECQADARLAHLPCVRRLSGGGAILHHHEQTYSCCVPPTHSLAREPSLLYHHMHAVVEDLLRESGITTHPRGQEFSEGIEPFLCFLREAAPDLVIGRQKILGSAQRRRRGAVLQHGSLLLKASEHAPELLGVSDLIPDFAWSPKLAEKLGERLASVLGARKVTTNLSQAIQNAATVRASRYEFRTPLHVT